MSFIEPSSPDAIPQLQPFAPNPPLLAFAVAAWSGMHPIEDPDDPSAEQCHLMAAVILAYTRGQAEEIAAEHFRKCFILEDSTLVLCSAVEITLSIPELVRVVPGLKVLPTSEGVSYTRGEIHEGRWYMTSFGNPGGPAVGVLTAEIRQKLREREASQ